MNGNGTGEISVPFKWMGKGEKHGHGYDPRAFCRSDHRCVVKLANRPATSLNCTYSLSRRAVCAIFDMSAADVLRTSAMERIEDEFDLRELEEAVATTSGEFISHDEVKKRLGF
jgi:hypothetical protein